VRRGGAEKEYKRVGVDIWSPENRTHKKKCGAFQEKRDMRTSNMFFEVQAALVI
jgi:hypothetical protein